MTSINVVERLAHRDRKLARMTVKRGFVEPSTNLVSFSCPHAECGALAKQTWFVVRVAANNKNDRPFVMGESRYVERVADQSFDKEERERFLPIFAKLVEGRPFLQDKEEGYGRTLANINLSQCYACDQFAIWLGEGLIWPHASEAPEPPSDLPQGLLSDYLEAAQIVNLSPRGSAALLRLLIQNLCKHLGAPGKNINDDIAFLVAKGLDPRVQQSLDTVRLVGNDALHPGFMDLRDDRSTALALFGLVNIIVDIMISQPAHIADLYGRLDPSKLKAIEHRDKLKGQD